MSSRVHHKFMVSTAIQRVLGRAMDRAIINSLADLKRAYEQEIEAHGAEIAAEADRMMRVDREIGQRNRAHAIRERLRCGECGGPLEGQRVSRWFCSDRCRQRAHRERQAAAKGNVILMAVLSKVTARS